jgi:radical SAM protein with 4Fe4S-binding SPASM domain
MATNKPFEFFVQWHLTEKCNLQCRHCYQDGHSLDELSLPEIKKVIVEASDMIKTWSETYGIDFSRSMNVTGGEPLLKQDLFEILGEIKRHGFDTYLLTNGTLVTRKHARELADLGINGVQVSIEGCEDVHDAIRGKGSFAAALTGIENLIDAGPMVTLNVTLSNLNASSLTKVIACGTHVGARRIGFSRLVPSGKGSSLLSQMLSSQQVKELYTSLFSIEVKGFEIVTGDPVASQMNARPNVDAGNIAVSGCAAGVSGLTIQPDGTITPCRRMPIPIGNVRKDSLRELWASSPVLSALRDRNQYRGKCGACKRWAHCRGCRAIAYACSQSRGEDDFLADDPQCFLEL